MSPSNQTSGATRNSRILAIADPFMLLVVILLRWRSALISGMRGELAPRLLDSGAGESLCRATFSSAIVGTESSAFLPATADG